MTMSWSPPVRFDGSATRSTQVRWPSGWGGTGYAELAPAGSLALVRSCNHQRVADRGKDAAGQVRCTVRGPVGSFRDCGDAQVVSENLMNQLQSFHLYAQGLPSNRAILTYSLAPRR